MRVRFRQVSRSGTVRLMPSTTLVRAPGETLADALSDLTKIASAIRLALTDNVMRDVADDLPPCGVTVVRRSDDTVVAAFVDPEVPAPLIVDEPLLGFPRPGATA